MNTPLFKTNTLMFKRYIKNQAQFDVIFANCSDFIVRQILLYRFKYGYDWVKIGCYLHNTPDSVRMILSRYLKEVTSV
jgi:hypothetical protein